MKWHVLGATTFPNDRRVEWWKKRPRVDGSRRNIPAGQDLLTGNVLQESQLHTQSVGAAGGPPVNGSLLGEALGEPWHLAA